MMVFAKLNIRRLVPEEYKGFKIYIDKKTNRFGTYYYVNIYDKNLKRLLHTTQANINFGVVREDNKQEVLQKTKEFIDNTLIRNVNNSKVSIGDIFWTSWGYDQTNYDYLKVLKVNPSGKTAICQMIDSDDFERSKDLFMTTVQRPNPQKTYGKPFRMQIQYYRGIVELRGSYFLGRGNDSKRLGTFQEWDGEKTFYETHYA